MVWNEKHKATLTVWCILFCNYHQGFCEIAQLLDLDLDKKTVYTLYNLIDCGVNPDAIAAMIKEMRQAE